ncbi:MAG: thioredoxin domain-containing protein [Candidatus Falkowbacteria bacterium]
MKRRTIFLAILVVSILAMVTLIISKKTNNDVASLDIPNKLNESENLLEVNGSAVNGASAKVNASIPAISANDQLLLGEKDATLKMVVYEDMTNPYSLAYDGILKQVIKDFSGKLAIYVRPYFESDNSLALTYQVAVACAGEEGKFNEMHDFIFAQKPMTEEALVDGAKKLSLNGTKFSACLNDSESQAKIASSVADIRMIAVYGAPTSILDGEIITGARSLDDIKNGEGENIEGLKSIINRHLSGK